MRDKCNGEKKFTRERIQKALLRLSVLSVFALVALWNLLVESKVLEQLSQKKGALWETLAEVRNLNLHIQLRFYQLLSAACFTMEIMSTRAF